MPAPVLCEVTPVSGDAASEDRVLPWHARVPAEALAMVVAWVGLVVVVRRDAGLDGAAFMIGLLALVPPLVVCGVQRLPLGVLGLAAALPAGVLATAALAPGGAVDVQRAGTYAYGALAALVVMAYARTATRRSAVAVALLLVVLDQFTVAWLPWWGSEDAGTLMIGTFYWHNQFGAFCAGGAVLALGFALLADQRARWLGVGMAAFAVLGVLLSGSRASLFALLAAVASLALLAWWARGARRTATWLLITSAATLALGSLLVSPLFFPERGSPWGPMSARLTEGSLDSHTTARWEFWLAAMEIFRASWLTGPGLGTFGDLSRAHVPVGVGLSADPHNELMRALAEGGLLSGGPLLAALVAVLVMAGRKLSTLRQIPRRAIAADPARWAALCATGALMAHALVDFDWRYPALIGLAGAMTGLAAAGVTAPQRHRDVPVPRAGRTAVALLVVAVAVAAGFTGAALHERAERALAAPGVSDDRAAWSSAFPDHRLAVKVMLDESTDPAGRAWARAVLADRAQVDPPLALTVASSYLADRQETEALRLARTAAAMGGERNTPWVLGYAALLGEAGQGELASATAATAVAVQSQQTGETASNRLLAFSLAERIVTTDEAAACVQELTEQGRAAAQGVLPVACSDFTNGEALP